MDYKTYNLMQIMFIIAPLYIAFLASIQFVFKIDYKRKSKLLNLAIIVLCIFIHSFIIASYTYSEIKVNLFTILVAILIFKILFKSNIKLIVVIVLNVCNIFISTLMLSSLAHTILEKYIFVDNYNLHWMMNIFNKFPFMITNIIFLLVFYFISSQYNFSKVQIDILQSRNRILNNFFSFEIINFLFLLFVYSNFIVYIKLNFDYDIAIVALTIILSLFVSYIIYSVISNMVQKDYLEILNKAIENQFENQLNHYASLERYIKNTRIIVHDTKHHILVLNTLINKGRLDEAKMYINELNHDLFILENEKICENKIIEAIVQSNIFKCSNKNINLSHNIRVPDDINIDNRDLAIIFGNLLNNALEAVENIKSDSLKKFIEINVSVVDGKLVANIFNSKDNRVTVFGKTFKTTKKDTINHGLGVNSVRESISKYDGYINFQNLENYFKVSFFIPLK